jgi:hypothetical protein
VPDTFGVPDEVVALGVTELEADGLDEEEDEDDGELLQAAAASPRQAMPIAAANRLFDDRKVSTPRQ